jgi:hypothetical protein
LSAFTDFGTEHVVLDAFKSSRTWISGTNAEWEDGRSVAVDRHGWVRALLPGQIARTLMFWDIDGRYPAGRYVVTYEGRGRLDYWSTARVVDAAPGRDLVEVDTPKNGLAVFLRETDPSDPLRNIRVVPPGGVCEGDSRTPCKIDAECDSKTCLALPAVPNQRFNPLFLRRARKYSVLRFMDWAQTNNSKERTWAERPLVSDARWTVKGVPLETMIDLANELDAAPWFTLPHLADDDYVRRYATLVREQSKSPRIYVELSNEVWNGTFDQSAYAIEQGTRRGLGSDPFESGMRWYSERAVEVFRIFEDVFGGKERLVRVLASQAANPWVSNTIVEHRRAYEAADALAIAPYFGDELGTPEHAARVSSMSVDGLLAELEERAVPSTARNVKEHARIAKEHGMQLIAYEAGQHLVGVGPLQNDTRLNELFTAANRHARMRDIYLSYLRLWKENGGTLLVHYSSTSSFSRYGRWGALEWLNQPPDEAPKYRALLEFIEQNPTWW